MLSLHQTEVLPQIAAAAVVAEKATGCPAELSTAQCILESGWLTHCPGNNCFGIKATDSNASYYVTKEYWRGLHNGGRWATERDAFEAYPTLADCFIAHGRLITEGEPYEDAWQQYGQDKDLDSLIGGIARRYATDPLYWQELMTLAHGPHVEAAIAAARQQNGSQ